MPARSHTRIFELIAIQRVLIGRPPGAQDVLVPAPGDQGLKRRRAAAAPYKPAEIDLLLVAEAPPKALDRYFYFEDVPTQDSLFRYACRVLLGREPTRAGKRELLEQLRDKGVFLIDPKETPMDGTPLAKDVPSLIERCRALKPRRIVLIKATVYDAAYRALADAGLPNERSELEFVEACRRALQAKPA